MTTVAVGSHSFRGRLLCGIKNALAFAAGFLACTAAGLVARRAGIAMAAVTVSLVLLAAWKALRHCERNASRLLEDWCPPTRETSLATAIHQASDGIVVSNPLGEIEYVNPAFTKMTGYSPEEALGKNPRFLKSGKQEPDFYRELWETIRAGRIWRGCLVNRRKDGTLYEEEMSITPVFDSAGAIVNFIAIKQDVTARNRAEAALRKSEENYRLLVDSIPDVVWISDEAGNLDFISPNVEALIGYTPQELYADGAPFRSVHPDDAPAMRDAGARLLATGERFNLEYRAQRKDGVWIWEHSRAVNTFCRNGKHYIVGTCVEITDRKRVEAALTKSERQYRSLITNIPDAIWVIDAEGKVVFANVSPKIEKLLGQTTQDLYEKGTQMWFTILHPDDLPPVRQAMEALFTRGEPYDVECRVRTKSGEWAWMHDRAVLRQEEDGKIYAHGLLSDITEHKRIEESRRRSEARYSRLFDRNLAGVFRTALGGRVLDCNSAMARNLGYASREEFLSVVLTAPELYCRTADRDVFVKVLVENKFVSDYELDLRRKDGSPVTFLMNASLIEDEDGGGLIVEGTLFDISHRKSAERELKKAKDAAEAASQAKSEFLANMSHEIRTPLNGLLGMTELALGTALSEEQRDYLEVARSSGYALLGVINDILDFSKIEARRLDLEHIRFALRDTLAGALKPLEMQANEKGLDLTLTMAPGVPEYLLGDPGRLRQVVLNLTGNAVKFTSRGEVAVRVETASRSSDVVTLAFSIRDTGIGIPREKQASIFEAFSQVDTSVTRRFGGTGLGLTISSQLVSMMDGQIWLESEPGKGSTFHFTVQLQLADSPAEPGTPAPTRVAPHTAGAGKTELEILVVDDNPVNRELAVKMLKRRGHSVESADSGRHALETLAEKRFDVIFMDVQMPEMDGFVTTANIRRRERPAGIHTPIIAMTACAMEGDREQCLAAGMDDYIAKPVSMKDLIAVAERAARPSTLVM